LSGFPTKTVYKIPPLCHMCYMTNPSHPPWFDHPNKIWWSVKVVNNSSLPECIWGWGGMDMWHAWRREEVLTGF
jgi:hypothetical protein